MENYLLEDFNMIGVASGATIYNKKGHKMKLISVCDDCKDDSKLSIQNTITKELDIYGTNGVKKIEPTDENTLVFRVVFEDYWIATVIEKNGDNKIIYPIQNGESNCFEDINKAIEIIPQININEENFSKGLSQVKFKRYL